MVVTIAVALATFITGFFVGANNTKLRDSIVGDFKDSLSTIKIEVDALKEEIVKLKSKI